MGERPVAMFDRNWMESWRSAVNADGPLKVIGKHLNAEILLEFGDTPYCVSFQNGSVSEVSDEIGPETCYQFALRAPRESWEKFCQKTPPPMYNDIWAMGHPLHGRLRIEGDQKVLWQNLRAITWALDLMRKAA
jgi:hypothetical protein